MHPLGITIQLFQHMPGRIGLLLTYTCVYCLQSFLQATTMFMPNIMQLPHADGMPKRDTLEIFALTHHTPTPCIGYFLADMTMPLPLAPTCIHWPWEHRWLIPHDWYSLGFWF